MTWRFGGEEEGGLSDRTPEAAAEGKGERKPSEDGGRTRRSWNWWVVGRGRSVKPLTVAIGTWRSLPGTHMWPGSARVSELGKNSKEHGK